MTSLADRVIQVPIGGIAMAQPPQIVSTLLGSCVGMVIMDLKHHIVVLAHVVRPDGVGQGMGSGYFANVAALNARDLALQSGADPRQLIVKMAGGGSTARSSKIITVLWGDRPHMPSSWPFSPRLCQMHSS